MKLKMRKRTHKHKSEKKPLTTGFRVGSTQHARNVPRIQSEIGLVESPDSPDTEAPSCR